MASVVTMSRWAFVLALVGCGGAEPVLAPIVASAPIEEASGDWRSDLEAMTLQGFVLVPSEGVKWPSAEAARAGKGTPSESVTVHRVVNDLGDVVEVLPIRRGDDHCHIGTYASVSRFRVSGFVRKRDLEVALTKHVVIEGSDGTGFEVRAGARVVERGNGRVAVVEDIEVALPPTAEVGLSYPELDGRRFPSPPRDFDWHGREAGPEPTFVLSDAELRVGDQVFAGSSIADDAQLSVARTVAGSGATRTVTVAGGCVSLRATVSAEHLRDGYERRGGGMGYGSGGMGIGRGGFGAPPPPPKEHYVPEGTPLFWKGSERAAGELIEAIRSYPIDAPACLAVDQGFADDPEVCYAPSAVVRDCRSECRENGLCAVSADGGRCVAATVDHCKASSECEYHGACTLRGESCVAAGDEDCAPSLYCETDPHACMAHQGRCVVTPNPDCANRPACKNEGRCVAGELGQCIAGDAGECLTSADCARLGNCAPQGDACAPREHRHCRNSALCKDEGRCALEGGRCVVVSASDCRSSTSCAARGACGIAHHTEDTGFGGLGGFGGEPKKMAYCAPENDDDCQKARLCDGESCRIENAWGRKHCAF
jgi:hypothetical protein